MTAAVYAGFDQATLDRLYSPSSCVDDISVFLDEYAARSARATATLTRRTLRYGPGPRMELDFFPAAEAGAPLHVFVHGGYWQELSKDESTFPALDFVPAGVAYAALGYGLAPSHSLDDIVASVRAGLRWLVTHAPELGVDPDRVHVSGSCAGAQLVAMALPDVPKVAGATLLSGVYDLEPIRLSYVNRLLRLDAAGADRNSPLRHLPDRLPPLIVARGGVETTEFIRQHDDFVAAVGGVAESVVDLVVEHRNHFDITFDLAAPATVLGRAVRSLMGLARP